MKKSLGKQVISNYVSQHLGCTFQDIRHGIGLNSSVVSSSLWWMNKDGRVKREGECRSYRYTLIGTTAVTESDSSAQYHQRPGGVNPVTNLFNQCLTGVRE